MKARIYANLNRPSYWSIKQRIDGKWSVVGHATQVGLIDVASFVGGSHARVRRTGQREVFAWLEGDLHHVDGFVSYKDRTYTLVDDPIDYGWSDDDLSLITFKPFEEEGRGFIWESLNDEMDYAHRCYFDDSRKCWGYV